MTRHPLPHRPRVLDLFCGYGGWSLGAKAAGCSVDGGVNHWLPAVTTWKGIHPEAVAIQEDVLRLDPRRLPTHDLLLASPACQGHSPARGEEKPHHDALRDTADGVIRCVEATAPPLFIVENVVGLRDWRRYASWLHGFLALGYGVSETILDAADYGAAQTRKRLLIVGRLHGTPIELQPKRSPFVSAGETIDWNAGKWRPWRTLCDNTRTRIERGQEKFGDRFLVRYNGAAAHGRPVNLPWGTLTTKPRFGIVDGDRFRMPRIEEYRRAFGVPDDVILTGGFVDQVKQLGNSVPVTFAEAVIRAVLAAVGWQ